MPINNVLIINTFIIRYTHTNFNVSYYYIVNRNFDYLILWQSVLIACSLKGQILFNCETQHQTRANNWFGGIWMNYSGTNDVRLTHRSKNYTVLLTFFTTFCSVSCLDADIRYCTCWRISEIYRPFFLTLQTGTVLINHRM